MSLLAGDIFGFLSYVCSWMYTIDIPCVSRIYSMYIYNYMHFLRAAPFAGGVWRRRLHAWWMLDSLPCFWASASRTTGACSMECWTLQATEASSFSKWYLESRCCSLRCSCFALVAQARCRRMRWRSAIDRGDVCPWKFVFWDTLIQKVICKI